MDQHLTAMEQQITDLERRIAEQRALVLSTPTHKRGHSGRKARQRVLADLQAKREQLLARVQRWTVGASRGMEVG